MSRRRRKRVTRVPIPTAWSPEQAAAAIGMLERIADAIWEDYSDAIWAWRDQERELAMRSNALAPKKRHGE